MSNATFLKPTTKNEDWSKVYCKEVNAGTLNIDNMIVTGLTATNIVTTTLRSQTNTFGISPNQYSMPAPLVTIDPGQVVAATTANAANFVTLRRLSIQFGGSMDANPRFMVFGGSPGLAAPAVFDINSQFKAPYTVRLTHLTYVTQSGNTTSSWNIYNGAGIVHTFTFPANGVYALPTSLTWVAGETMSISWLGVGTQPDSTGMTAFFNQVE